MRAELKNISSSQNYPDEYDLSRTIWIAKNLHSGRLELAMKHQQEVAKECKTDEELFTYADDIHWYAFEESHFIWHFCLWRLQAIFEGIIVGKYLTTKSGKGLLGLKAKLDDMQKAGYKIEGSDYSELLKWAEIRNQLSHFPPFSHSPGPLEENDVTEYYELCKKLCKEWNNQKIGTT